MPQTDVKTKVDVTTIVKVTLVSLTGLALFGLAGFAFMKTEVEPTIKNNLPGWQISFDDPKNYSFNPEKIEIIDNTVQLKKDQYQGIISNKPNISSGCPKNHPAVLFLTSQENNVNFQISKDNLNWYYWNRKNKIWDNARTLVESNNGRDINNNIRNFYPRTLNRFFFKAILNSPNDKLHSVSFACDSSSLKKFQLYPKSL